jgi:hypothetical protein
MVSEVEPGLSRQIRLEGWAEGKELGAFKVLQNEYVKAGSQEVGRGLGMKMTMNHLLGSTPHTQISQYPPSHCFPSPVG